MTAARGASAAPDDGDAAPHAAITRAVDVAKPWGREAVFADGAHGYVGKLLTVRAGEALSLQRHAEKDETIVVVSGQGLLEHGPAADRLTSHLLRPGDVAHLPAMVLHRLTAVSDLLVAETSTAAPGWREDVVRFADRYGREGTTRP